MSEVKGVTNIVDAECTSLLNVLPDGWEQITIADIGKVVTGSTPSTTNPIFWGGSIPFISPADFKGLVYVGNTGRTLTESGANKGRLLPQDAILVTCIGSLGGIAMSSKLSTTNQQINAVVASSNENSRYHYYNILFNIDELKKNAGTTTLPIINKSTFERINLLRPPLPEQQKIAAILSSVDEVIEKTQAQIDKLKDLKTGMMQELLTKGIGHTEFKDSPVGLIPVEWEAILLDTIAKRGSGHTPNKLKPEYWNGGIKWVSLTDSSRLDKLYINDTVKKISQLGIENSSATPHPIGTVVMARDAGVGKSAILTEQMAVSQHFMAWVCGDKLDNYYLYYLLQHWKPRFENIAMGSTIKTIGLPYFKKLYVPVPSINEQLKISQALRSVDEKIFSLEKKSIATKNTKKALMQDLLTGKVRVNTEQTNKEVVVD